LDEGINRIADYYQKDLHLDDKALAEIRNNGFNQVADVIQKFIEDEEFRTQILQAL